MNDYKELIEVLKNAEHIALCGNGAFNTVLVERCYEAADAIEQLVRERDAAVAEMRKEADNCRWCKWWKYTKNFVQRCTCEEPCCVDGNPDRWEWRGVQE